MQEWAIRTHRRQQQVVLQNGLASSKAACTRHLKRRLGHGRSAATHGTWSNLTECRQAFRMDATDLYRCRETTNAFRPAFFRAMLARSLDAGGRVIGVLLLIRLLGRQYSLPGPGWPHGCPVRLSFHFSAAHRLRLAPACVFRTCPDFFRHLAVACAALADHLP